MEVSLLALLTQGFLCWSIVSSAPIHHPTDLGSPTLSFFPRASDATIFQLSDATSTGFLWSSIGLAVLTAFLQGLVTSLTYMAESSNSWTFRFRLAKVEHWWWTLVSCLLFASLCSNVISFISGNSDETVAVLVLSTTTLLAIVQYMLPAWRSRQYLNNRFLAWTGPSRTGVNTNLQSFCGGKDDWYKLAKEAKSRGAKGVSSDNYGWRLVHVRGIQMDPTDILNSGVVNPQTVCRTQSTQYIYHDGYHDHETVSLLWGAHSGFLPRVSRSISSVPITLLKSTPFTNDGFAGEGLCLAMGILGRNKGLKPRDLVFNMNGALTTELETDSTWYPRPSKTLRSYYRKLLKDIHGGLGDAFVCVAVELSLIMMDASSTAVAAWLKAGCDHQSISVNEDLRRHDATCEELRAHYESSYVSMIISINNMKDGKIGQHNHGKAEAVRPDIICLGLLLMARGEPKPAWWGLEKFQSYRQGEEAHLDFKWRDAAAKLLGLSSFPSGSNHEYWGEDSRVNKDSETTITISEGLVYPSTSYSQISP